MSVRGGGESPDFEKYFKLNAILSPRDVFLQKKNLNRCVPPKGGAKDFAPEETWLQNKKLKAFYEERKHVLCEQRVEKEASLLIGEWDPERNLVEFKKDAKKFWTHMGFVVDKRKWLFPEEALYLMEINFLEVYYGSIPISIQQAYLTFLGTGVSLEEYQIYAHLRRLGYIVIRHQETVDVTPYERTIKLDQHAKLNRKKRCLSINSSNTDKDDSTVDSPDGRSGNKRHKVATSPNVVKPHLEEMNEKICAASEPQADLEQSLSKELIDTQLNRSSVHTSAEKYRLSTGWTSDVSAAEAIPCTDWDYSKIFFPDIAGKSVVTIKCAPGQLLPPNSLTEQREYTFDVQEYRETLMCMHKYYRTNKLKNESILEGLEFSFADFMNIRKVKANNWTEYKQKLLTTKLEKCQMKSPLAHLWDDDVKPLISPKDAISTGHILEKLQVIKSSKLLDNSSSSSKSETTWRVVYDVYQPGGHFKKTNPGLPHFRVCVAGCSLEGPPDLATFSCLISRYQDLVPMNWAINDHGEVAFYTFTGITIPVDITHG